MRRNDFFKYLLLGGGGSASRSELESETLPYTFVSKSQRLKDYRIYGNTVDGESVGDLVETGEHTGEYLVPITITDGTLTQTTDIYLPIQLKKLGDEFEYIDFKKQKQYRIRKNLVNITSSNYEIRNYGVTWTINEDNSVTANGSTQSPFALFLIKLYLKQGSYIINGCSENGGQNTYRCEIRDTGLSTISQDVGSGVTVNIASDGFYYYSIRISSGYTCDNLTFYPMIRKSGIEDDTYEPYIENTEIDVVIPALPIAEGTNTLSIGTAVQPSKIWIQGNVSEIPPVSASLNSIPQSLRMIDLSKDKVSEPENEDLQLDIVPVEKYVINLKDSEKTIEPTKVERGVESAE